MEGAIGFGSDCLSSEPCIAQHWANDEKNQSCASSDKDQKRTIRVISLRQHVKYVHYWTSGGCGRKLRILCRPRSKHGRSFVRIRDMR